MITQDHLGVDFGSEEKLCEKYEISKQCLYQRINKLHWDLEKALTTPVRSKKKTKKGADSEKADTTNTTDNKKMTPECFAIHSNYPARESIRYYSHQIIDLENDLKKRLNIETISAVRERIKKYNQYIKDADSFFFHAMDIYFNGEMDVLKKTCDKNTIQAIEIGMENLEGLAKNIYVDFANIFKMRRILMT